MAELSVDAAIADAIDDALKDFKEDHPDFARSFARIVQLKLNGKFRESDLDGLIEDVPLSVIEDRS